MSQTPAHHHNDPTQTNSRKRSRDSDSSSSTSSASSSSSSLAVQRRRVINTRSTLRGRKNLSHVQDDVLCYLMSFLEVDALKSVVFVSRSLANACKAYFQMLLNASAFYIYVSLPINDCSDDDEMKFNFPNLNKAMEMLQILSTLPGHDSDKKMTLELEEGVHEVVGSWQAPWGTTFQKMLSVPCNHLSFVGQGQK